jgi:regulator of sigma E protease
MPGSPAWQAGFMPGDEIIELGGREDPTFLQLRSGVTLGDLERGIPCEVKRASDGEVVQRTLRPTQEAGELASVGIGGPLSLNLRDDRPVYPESAATEAKLISTPTQDSPLSEKINANKKDKKKADPNKLQGGDTIVSLNGVSVADYGQYIAELIKATDKPIKIGVRRNLAKGKDAGRGEADSNASETALLEFELPPQPMRDLGFVLKMGPVTAVQKGSPAETANVKEGDRIVAVDGNPIANTPDNLEGWTPVTLPEYLRAAAVAERQVELTLRRGASENSDGEELKVQLMPEVSRSISSIVPVGAPMAADAIGVAYSIENVVHAVSLTSPVATAGVQAGDRLASATIYLPKNDTTAKAPEHEEVKLGRDHLNWPAIMDAVQFAPAGTKVELHLLRGDNREPITVTVTPEVIPGVFLVPRGLDFEPIYRIRTASTLSEAVRLGFAETTEALTMVFRFLQKLGGQVPFKMLGGPGTIAVAAGDAASHGLSSLLIFLTMLSANLAVINFLPIPLLDGGHMMFLAYEGARGRPANDKVVLGLHMAGFVFIIGLMVFVIGLDIQRWILT